MCVYLIFLSSSQGTLIHQELFSHKEVKKMEEMSTSSTVLPPPPPFLILLALVIYTVDQGIEHCPQHTCMPLYGEAVTFSSLCIL